MNKIELKEKVMENKNIEMKEKDIEDLEKYKDYTWFSSILGFIGICIWLSGSWIGIIPLLIWPSLVFIFGILSIFYREKARKNGVTTWPSTILSILSGFLGIGGLFGLIIYLMI